MKLLRESPVGFHVSSSPLPERVYVGAMKGAFGTAVAAGTPGGLLSLRLGATPAEVAEDIGRRWGVDTAFDDGVFDRIFLEDLASYLDGGTGLVRARILAVGLTPFTVEVHRLLARIPFGETLTYGEVAAQLGKPGAARAVGGACGRNRSLIVVPCHRVLASDGLGGFGAGLGMKRKLLDHERRHKART